MRISGVFGQLELDVIRTRVRSGMENVRAKGKQIGWSQITVDILPFDSSGTTPPIRVDTSTSANWQEFVISAEPCRTSILDFGKGKIEPGATAPGSSTH